VCVAGGAGGISSSMAVMARNGIVNLGVASATSRSTFFKTASSSSSSSSSTAFQGQLVMPHLLDWKQLLESQSLIYVVRRKKQLSSSVAGVGCVAQIATTSSSSSVTDDDEVKEKKKKADAYFASDSRPIVLFDGVCNMCNGGVNFVLDNDPVGRLRFAALQSEAGRALLLRSGRAPDDISSLVLVEKDRSYIKSEGVLRTAQYLQSLFPPIASIALLFPLFFRDFVYESIADNRYSVFGQTDVCRMSDAQFKERFIE